MLANISTFLNGAKDTDCQPIWQYVLYCLYFRIGQFTRTSHSEVRMICDLVSVTCYIAFDWHIFVNNLY